MADVGAIAGAAGTIIAVLGSHWRTRRTLRNDFTDIKGTLDAHLEKHNMADLIENEELKQQVDQLKRRLNSRNDRKE